MKKLLMLACLMLCLSSSVMAQSSSSSSSAAAPAPAVTPTVISFVLIPKVVKIVNNVGKEVVLAAALSSPFNLPNAQLIGSLKNGKIKMRYNKALKAFIKEVNLTEAMFQPLETYLKTQLKLAKKTPEPFVQLADTYLKTGLATGFSLSI